MGQYFKAINLDKQEYVCPWCIGGGAKLWEWAVNSQGAIFTLLLRQSTETGGGDFAGPGPQVIELKDGDDLSCIIGKAVAREGMPIRLPAESIVGRWAGNRVTLIGDYDESGLYQKAKQYTNISEPLVEAWNRFVDFDDAKLEYREDCSCSET
ncbi:hypothetical protein RMSM_01896 [Rhodopirellula maiorica SM1]|uniref:Uncharacterized protein n=1 Tax=Rhodopirellula maiorica SM1 TaxID=1265738 RepID=M5S0J3_9BACT|nr:hypothetical protein [Rhodopirellula maiorica]EMI21172.1 hypothetical protein RMSM_01896 [Rhodopirellula maiorica SM1]